MARFGEIHCLKEGLAFVCSCSTDTPADVRLDAQSNGSDSAGTGPHSSVPGVRYRTRTQDILYKGIVDQECGHQNNKTLSPDLYTTVLKVIGCSVFCFIFTATRQVCKVQASVITWLLHLKCWFNCARNVKTFLMKFATGYHSDKHSSGDERVWYFTRNR